MRVVIFVLSVLLLLCFAGDSRADKKGPPSSRKQATRDGKYLFVMLAPGSAEDEINRQGDEENRKALKSLRDTYTKSGLYKNDTSNDPLWTVDWHAPFLLSNDGIHVVRYGQATLEQWRNKTPRQTRAITDNDMKQEAISIFARGKLLREYSIGEFVDDRKVLPMTVTFFQWSKQVKFIEDERQLEVITLDGNRIRIELATGKILEKKRAQ
jgi:hypothetical protein